MLHRVFLLSSAHAGRPRARLIVIVSLCLAFGRLFAEDLPPAPKDYFNDYANVTSPATQHELDERLAKFDKETSNQVVVAIFPKMDSTRSLNEYTLQIVNAWGVGQRGKNNGVALFVFVQNHTMRIQVGIGLTDVLTDALCKQILDTDLAPNFRKGDFNAALTAGTDAILKILTESTRSNHSLAK